MSSDSFKNVTYSLKNHTHTHTRIDMPWNNQTILKAYSNLLINFGINQPFSIGMWHKVGLMWGALQKANLLLSHIGYFSIWF